jgi:hypothetical protein
MLDRLDALPNDELRDLIRRSYEMVAAAAPKARTRGPGRKKKAARAKMPERKAPAKKRKKR